MHCSPNVVTSCRPAYLRQLTLRDPPRMTPRQTVANGRRVDGNHAVKRRTVRMWAPCPPVHLAGASDAGLVISGRQPDPSKVQAQRPLKLSRGPSGGGAKRQGGEWRTADLTPTCALRRRCRLWRPGRRGRFWTREGEVNRTTLVHNEDSPHRCFTNPLDQA